MSIKSKIAWGTAFVLLVFLIIALFSPYKISTFLSEYWQNDFKKQVVTKEEKSPPIPKAEKKESIDPSSLEKPKPEDIIKDTTNLTEITTSETAGSGEVFEYKDLEYTKPAGQSLKMDIFVPKDVTEKPPLLLWIHGGGWIEGDKESCPSKTFTKHGYAMACVDYRLAKRDDTTGSCPDDFIFPAQIHDIKAAVRWLRQNSATYGYDSTNIAAMGNSSGAHLASLLGTSYGEKELQGTENSGYSDKVQAVVDYYGPVDVTQTPPKIVFTEDPCTTSLPELNTKYSGEETPFFYWTRAWGLFVGGSLSDSNVIQQAKKASPLTYIDSSDPPFIIFHGKNDGMIPDGQSKLLVSALQNAGVDVTFVNTEGSHDYSNPDPYEEVSSEYLTPTLKFLEKYLKSQ